MRIISKPILLRFIYRRPDARAAIIRWFESVRVAQWATPHDVKKWQASVSIVDHERVVFNVGGNAFRIVAAVVYRSQSVFVKFVGTHAEYDEIDAATVEPETRMP